MSKEDVERDIKKITAKIRKGLPVGEKLTLALATLRELNAELACYRRLENDE